MKKLAFLAILGALTVTSALPSQVRAEEEALQSMLKRLDSLEKRQELFEQNVLKRLTALEQKSAPPVADPEKEAKAREALQKVNALADGGKIAEAKSELNSFLKDFSTTRTAVMAQRLVQELAVVGKDAPANWAVEKWLQGEKDVLLDGRKPTLAVFWEVWCPHCKREVPKIEEIYATYKPRGLQVVGFTKINRGATEEQVLAFLNSSKVSYPIAKESGALSSHFSVAGVPAAAIVKDGKVVWRGHPAKLTNQVIESFIGHK